MTRSWTTIRNISFEQILEESRSTISALISVFGSLDSEVEAFLGRRIAQAAFAVAIVFGLLAIPVTAFAKSSCLLAEQDSCVLKTDYQGLKVQVDERGRIVVVFGNSKEEFVRAESYVNVQEDLARLEAADDIEPGEAAQITSDLVKYDGANYAIPDSTELRSALGFPSTAAVTADDYLDLIRVHMQLVLSLSASAAGYLSDLLGVEAIDSIPAAVVETPKSVEPAAAPVVTPIPASTPTSAPAVPVSSPVAAPVVLPLPLPLATPDLAIPNRN